MSSAKKAVRIHSGSLDDHVIARVTELTANEDTLVYVDVQHVEGWCCDQGPPRHVPRKSMVRVVKGEPYFVRARDVK
jgi:hypothetical protein